ncbi:restriction endonuclease subunit S [Oleidesulfovibrio alaskensis]|uniref:restriction endonuclease subunit S n=1 Tax=Oleidesulfovibrio alaskensis TaxID=58180 RepID=UPI000421F197|nr:restriction endonuclease subunit S [Oleidesulfovibrio alaskensis]
MTEVAQARPRVFGVSYRELQTWSVAAQFAVNWNWPDEVIKPLSSILHRRTEAALETLTPESFATLLTIRFDGSIEPREPVQIKDVKGKLFRVFPGDVIFSKIDVRNGAIGLAPDDIDAMCATSEFPIYSVNIEKAHPEYVKLLFRTAAFKKLLNSMISGASGRKRIQPSQLEGVKVPIPPLPIQQKIVAHWEAAQLEQSQLLMKEQGLIKESQSTTLALLGIKKIEGKPVEKMFCLPWKDSERWSYEYNKRVLAGLSSVVTGVYPAIPLNSICTGVSGSTPSKKRSEYWADGTLPWVSPKDMKTRLITDSIDHISDNAVKERQAPVVPPGSILFVVRSGILQHTVPVAMTDISVSINQDIRAFTPNTENILAEYLLAYFEAKQDELLRLVKWSTTVQSINKEELESFPIPFPPVGKQKEIISTVRSYHVEIDSLRQNRNARILSAEREIEKMILGICPVEAH